jgi:hypothetical protein
VEYNRVPKGHRHTVENSYIILIEGKITVGEREGSLGYYKLMGTKAIITGPAKYMLSLNPFEDIRESEKRLSEAINRGVLNDGPTLFDQALRS